MKSDLYAFFVGLKALVAGFIGIGGPLLICPIPIKPAPERFTQRIIQLCVFVCVCVCVCVL